MSEILKLDTKVLEWAFEHRDELIEDWHLAVSKFPLRKIESLV